MKHDKLKKIFVEVAKTPHQHSKGLMFRDKLDEDSGMIFIFEKPRVLSFWGMNTFIPLDIAFLDEQGTIKDIRRIKRHDLNSVKSSCPCKYAIELEDGWFSKNGIKEGDFAELSLAEKDNIITFIKNIKTAQIKDDKDTLFSEEEVESDKDSKDNKEKDKSKEVRPPVANEEKLNIVDKAVNKVDPIVQPAANSLMQAQETKVSVPKFNSVYQAIPWAMQNMQVMRITYKTEHGHTVTRDVEPHRIYFSRRSKGQVLKAFDETSVHPSQYIVRNIVSFGFPGRKFTPKSIFNKRR
jgi:uncharacterized membrane protein (UPF0127 family)